MSRELILLIHSLLGVLIFLIGILQIILKKGGSTHVILGKSYLYGWLVLLISGAYLGGPLITLVGIFGYYFALTGSRVVQFKGGNISLFDKVIFYAALIIALSLIYYGVQLLLRGDQSFAIIFFVFGAIFVFTTIQDIYKYILGKPLKKQIYGNMDWYFEHFTRMFVSFIAAVTAFTSIQNVFRNNVLNFLLPTVIGVFLINRTQKHYQTKFKLQSEEK